MNALVGPETAPSQAAADPYVRTSAGIREAPATLGRALRQVGPGLILAASIVGTGELIQTTDLGARAGFTLLWLVILSCFIKVFVQIELGRHAIATGETTLTSFHQVPIVGRCLGWWWLAMMLLTQMQIGAMIGGVAQSLTLTAPAASIWLAEQAGALDTGLGRTLGDRPELPWALLATAATALFLVKGSYRIVERATMLMVVLFTLMTVACVVLLPWTAHAFGWVEVRSGLTFEIPRAAWWSALAMVGITGVGASELIAYPYWCIEKGYARSVGPATGTPDWYERARGWLAVLQLDAWVSMAIYTLATLAFFLLGAAILNRQGSDGLPGRISGMVDTLAQLYVPVLGTEGAFWFIVVGAFMVLYSTLFSATAANSRITADFLFVQGLVRDRGPGARRWWISLCCVVFPFVGLVLFLLFENPVLMVAVGGIAQSVTLPLIAGVSLYLRYRSTDRRLTSGRLWDLCLWMSFLVMSMAAIYGIVNSLWS